MPIHIKWEAEITKLRRDLHTLQKEHTTLQEKLRGVATEAKKGSREQEAMGRAAKRVYREIETPAERYNRKLAELRQLLLAGKLTVEQYGRAARRAHDEADAASERGGRGTAGWISRLAGVAAGYLSIQAAIQAVTREMESQDELRRQSRELAKELGDVQRETLVMLGPVPQKEREDFVKRMEALASELKPEGGLRTIYATMATALSAGGGKVPEAVAATREAARIAPQSAEAMTMISQALLHLGKATGTQDARENMGFLLGVAQQAAVTNMRDIAQYMSRGIIGVANIGGTAQEAGAIVAAITQAAPDPHGRIASTAAIGFAQQLDQYFAAKREELEAVAKRERGERLTRLEREAVDKMLAAESAGGYLRVEAAKMSPLQMIEYMRAHPEIRAEFMAGFSTEKITTAPIEQILGVTGRGDVGYRYLQQALPMMVKGEEAAKLYEQMLRGIDSIFDQGVSKIVRHQEETRDVLRALTPGGRQRVLEAPFTREELMKDLAAAGVGQWRRFWVGAAYVAGTTLGREQRDAYRLGIREATEGTTGLRGLILGGAGPWVTGEDAQVLRRRTEETMRMSEQLEELIQATREQTSILGGVLGISGAGVQVGTSGAGGNPGAMFGQPPIRQPVISPGVHRDLAAETSFSTN